MDRVSTGRLASRLVLSLVYPPCLFATNGGGRSIFRRTVRPTNEAVAEEGGRLVRGEKRKGARKTAAAWPGNLGTPFN